MKSVIITIDEIANDNVKVCCCLIQSDYKQKHHVVTINRNIMLSLYDADTFCLSNGCVKHYNIVTSTAKEHSFGF